MATAEVIALEPTPTQTEGPYWLPGSPQRTTLRESDTRGRPLAVEGRVVNIRGRPIEGVWLDFWQCDGEASYDVEGNRLRGHQWTDAEGRFKLETVFPTEYDDDLVNADGEVRRVYRTAHIHVKVKAPRRRTLTTQLYFPGEPGNSRDNGYSDACLLEMKQTPAGSLAHFTFVLP
jgi:protocatechuate 3,4-dioxygenase beta subunit